MPDADRIEATLPVHVAIIMDGNGRWAKARGLPRTAGHRKGIEAVRRTVEMAGNTGIKYLTIFGFSSENWRRPAAEVEDLMVLLRFYLRSEIAELHSKGIRLRVIGDRSRLAADIVQLIDRAEDLTRNNSAMHLTVALSYGGRQDIVQAVQALVAAGVPADQIDEDRLGQALWTAGLPDPDLLIRTSGEQRISNFFLWQSAYAELVFVDTLWPDFSQADLDYALREFGRRERRYGAVLETR